MADRSKLGTALSGMGAGFMGRGAEWNYYQDRARMEQQEIERQRLLAYQQDVMADVGSLYELLHAGQYNDAFSIINDGIYKAQANGQDDSVWRELASYTDPDNLKIQDLIDAVDADVTRLVGGGHMAAPPSLALKMAENEEAMKAKYRAEPDRIVLWKFMQQLPPEQREAFRTMAGQGVTVNTGLPKLPPGYQWNQTGDGVEPIPGGPQDPENPQNKQKTTGRAAMIKRAGTTVVQDLGRANELIPELINLDGMAGANARAAKGAIKGSPEWRFMKHINSAKSNIGLDRLQQMRENSPTGGALGQVPFQQQKRLEQVYGEVDLGMEIPEIEDNIKRIQNIYTDIIYGAPEERALAVQEGRMTQEESEAVDSLYSDVSFDLMGRSKQTAPPAALQYLKQNPDAINDFVKKYGYKPEGF